MSRLASVGLAISLTTLATSGATADDLDLPSRKARALTEARSEDRAVVEAAVADLADLAAGGYLSGVELHLVLWNDLANDAVDGLGEKGLPLLQSFIEKNGADAGPKTQYRPSALLAKDLSPEQVVAALDRVSSSGQQFVLFHLMRRDDLPKSILPPLIKRLTHEDEAVRHDAAMVIASMGENGSEAVPAIIELVRSSRAAVGDETYQARSTRLKTFGYMIEVIGTTATPALLAELKDGHAGHRIDAIFLLSRLRQVEQHQEVVPALVEALNDEDAAVVKCAAIELGLRRAEAAAGPVLDIWRDRPDAGEELTRALGRIGGEAVVEAMIEALGDATDEDRQARAALALGEIGDLRAADPLIESLTAGEAPSVRVASANALAKLGSTDALESLAETLRSSHPMEVRRAAAAALGTFGPSAREWTSSLVVAYDAADAPTRLTIAESVDAIDESDEAAIGLYKRLAVPLDAPVRREPSEERTTLLSSEALRALSRLTQLAPSDDEARRLITDAARAEIELGEGETVSHYVIFENLGKVGDSEARDLLKAFAEDETRSEWLREQARRFAAQVAERHAAREPAEQR